jgi:predicted translin family RNA/ssDNA-binding protein
MQLCTGVSKNDVGMDCPITPADRSTTSVLEAIDKIAKILNHETKTTTILLRNYNEIIQTIIPVVKATQTNVNLVIDMQGTLEGLVKNTFDTLSKKVKKAEEEVESFNDNIVEFANDYAKTKNKVESLTNPRSIRK